MSVNSHFSATEHMTTFYKIKPGLNDLMIYWTQPQYPPIEYKQIISCKLLCDHRTFNLREVILDETVRSSTIRALKPGSVCLINLIAVYNHASIDPGVGISTHTLYTSKYSMFEFGACMFSFHVNLHIGIHLSYLCSNLTVNCLSPYVHSTCNEFERKPSFSVESVLLTTI